MYHRYKIPCDLTLYEREMYITKIENEIAKRKSFLLEKRKNLNNIIKDNEFLKDVKNDYDKYYNSILSDRHNQYLALQKINEHIQNIITEGKLTDEDIIQAKKEQTNILNELNVIKNNLDDLTQNN